MENASLVVYVYRGGQKWSRFHTARGIVETSIPFVADVVGLLGSPRVKVLVFVPHCIARLRELKDLDGLVERVRDEIRNVLRMSRLNGEPIDRIFKENYGRSLMAETRVVPLECTGRWKIDGEVVEFQGDLLWMALRIMLFLEDELRDLPSEKLLLVDLSGRIYHAPVYAASNLVSASYPGVSMRYVYWEGSPRLGRPETNGRKVVKGAEELLTVANLLAALLKGCPGEPIHALPDLVDRLRRTELGERAAGGLLSMVGVVCGLKLPILPLAHLSILELMRTEIPYIRDPLDLEMNVELLRYDVRTVRYIYYSFGTELEDPLVALMIAATSYAKERIREMGIVPSLEEFEIVDRLTGRRLRLVDMSWEWLELISDFLLENGALTQLTTICAHLGPMLDICRENLGFRNSTGMRYDELWKLSREEGISLLADLLERSETAEDLMDEMREVMRDPSKVMEMREIIVSSAGLSPPLVYLIHALDRGVEFLYVVDLVRKLREPSSLVFLCSLR
ncbi:MAG: hypothetical protein QI197_04660 [Candidatus Korarchaeota archaeon]|nr:hypothetical protein [Candidatus Korarchaeota archaeon]